MKRRWRRSLFIPRGEGGPAGFDFSVGRWEVRVADGLLRNGRITRRLEPRAMAVLQCLARRPGELVSKDELVHEAWKDVAVSDGAIVRAIVVLRKALGDDPRRPVYVQTLARRGYVLVAPVKEAELARARSARSTRPLVAASAAALLALASLLLVGREPSPKPLLVEPFVELDRQSRVEGWSRAVADELGAKLAGVEDRVVFFSEAGSSDREEWAAAVVLAGSVRREGDRARVSCRLSDRASGRLVCAGACDVPVRSRLDAQQITARAIAEAVTEDRPQTR